MLAAAAWFATMPATLRAEGRSVAAVQGLAIGGYDPVAYFTEGRAVPGRQDHALKWRGAVWLFVSSDTMLAFEMNPRAYAPRFGGYCADALAAEGRLTPGDPRLFVIDDGRLYLLGSAAARDRWRHDADALAEQAQAHWPGVLKR